MQGKPKPPATPEHRRRTKVPRHPGIYKRGNRYQVSYRDRGKQHWKSFPNLSEAVRFKGRVNAGDTFVSSRRRFKDYALEWVETYQGRTSSGITESTRESYREAIRLHAIPYFGTIKLEEINTLVLKSYVNHLAAKGFAQATVRRYFAPIRAILRTAYDDDLLRHNPALGYRLFFPGKKTKEKQRLTAAETSALIDEIPPEQSDLVYLLAATGMRVSEGLALTWDDFQRNREGRLFLRITKSKTAAGVRRTAVSSGLAQRLLKHRERSKFAEGSDPIFPNAFGKRMDAHNFRRRIYRPAAVRAGVPWSTPHDLRHGLATLMAERGYSAAHIAAQLGHADGGKLALSTYIHVAPLESTDFIDEALSR